MTDALAKRQWPFKHWWANIGLVVVVVVVCVYLLGIASQLLIKPGSSHGQRRVSTAEVEEEIRDAATKQGAQVRSTQCKESSRNQWRCMIRLANGHFISGSATWYQSRHVLGVNVQLGSH
jgi:hypothetical protein